MGSNSKKTKADIPWEFVSHFFVNLCAFFVCLCEITSCNSRKLVKFVSFFVSPLHVFVLQPYS